MKRIVAALFLLLIVPLAAAESEYWAVSAEDGTTTDVVNAANFAASMKGSVAVSFTGKTFEQARQALIEQPIEDTVVVVFDGDDALVMASQGRFPKVVEASEKYLRGQGFSVDVEQPDLTYFLEEDRSEESPQPCPMDAKVCPDGTTVGRNPDNCDEFLACPESEPAGSEETDSPEPEESNQDPVEQESEKKPNVFVRVWQWFAGIFS